MRIEDRDFKVGKYFYLEFVNKAYKVIQLTEMDVAIRYKSTTQCLLLSTDLLLF